MLHCSRYGISDFERFVGGDMQAGQRVQLKSRPLAEAFSLKTSSTGTVLCSYKVAGRKPGCNELLDVRLDSQVTLWGVAADAFEESGSTPAPLVSSRS